MSTKTEVQAFLQDFKAKMSIYRIIFRDERGKNLQTLADLEMRPNAREEILKGLGVNDYSEGPLEETLYKGADMWVFGIMIKNKEIYIKISMGLANSNVLCISFHLAAHPMHYPFKNEML